ncbi:Hypothetical protein EUBREC_1841 [Agathobacter rectalis ATCC 33656]|uniref:Uncharacterized protein n=1 Tax=Agathobacter rectalis (strain ATCC 33656 / DSM 3377 / JCM 17463 / KCTC 5835 / VPI 0990) TaxID=515619 RepID=C4ZAT0_AGARV|nr:Hypothetical protein EUBREC_1841 [Agathobacter rectalis ATCC 33656]
MLFFLPFVVYSLFGCVSLYFKIIYNIHMKSYDIFVLFSYYNIIKCNL